MARCVYFPFKKFMEVLKDKAEFTDSSEAYSRERTQITSDKILYQVGMMSARILFRQSSELSEQPG